MQDLTGKLDQTKYVLVGDAEGNASTRDRCTILCVVVKIVVIFTEYE